MKYLFAGDFAGIVGSLQSIKIILSLLASVTMKKPLTVWTDPWYDFECGLSLENWDPSHLLLFCGELLRLLCRGEGKGVRLQVPRKS